MTKIRYIILSIISVLYFSCKEEPAPSIGGGNTGDAVLLIPESGGRIAAAQPQLLWEEGTQSDYSGKVYDVQISSDVSFSENTTKQLRVSNDNTVKVTDPPQINVGEKLFWRVRLVLSDGVGEWSKSSYFIKTEAPVVLMNESEFGMNMGLDWRPWGEELAVDAGFSWSRLNLPWYKLQGLDGNWDWNQTDLMFEVARKQKISVLGILGYTAKQFSSATGTDVYYIAPPTDIKPWIRYVSEVVTRYQGDVASWEIWNEHNHKSFYSGTPEEYAELLKTAYITIKNISPNSLVTFGGHSGFSPEFLDEVVAKIGNDYWDFMNWHCYPGMPDEAYYQNFVDKVFSYLKDNNLDKPVWLTEIGFSRNTSDANPDDYRISCLFVAHLAYNKQIVSGRARIEKIFPFQLVEGHGYGTVQEWAMVIDYPNSSTPPKRLPVFKAHAHAVRLLEEVNWQISNESSGVSIHQFQFKQPGTWSELNVVWGASKVIYIANENVEIRDVFGEVLQLPADKRLSLGSGVYYILSVGSAQISVVN